MTDETETLPVTLSEVKPMSAFADAANFENAQRMAKMLSTSTLVPKEFQKNIPNTVIALELAQRLGASPLAVMQNLFVIHGKPGWSAQYVIAALNTCGKFAPLRYRLEGDGDDRSCTAWTTDNTGEVLEGPAVTIQMAKAEGWYGKAGSKWQTMPELMLRYRSATFFGRLYAPEVMMGMQTVEEIKDVIEVNPTTGEVVNTAGTRTDAIKDRLRNHDQDELSLLDPDAQGAGCDAAAAG